MKPLTLNDIERLGELLAAVPDPFVPMEADQLDGFLTALCLLKVPPAIDDWFVYVLDASGNRRAKLADPAEQAELRRLVLARGADIESRILHEKPVDPIIYDEDIDEDDPEGELAALAPFADGFAFACSLWPELMKSQNKAVQAALVGILRHESPDEDGEEEETEAVDAAEEVRFRQPRRSVWKTSKPACRKLRKSPARMTSRKLPRRNLPSQKSAVNLSLELFRTPPRAAFSFCEQRQPTPPKSKPARQWQRLP